MKKALIYVLFVCFFFKFVPFTLPGIILFEIARSAFGIWDPAKSAEIADKKL